MEYDLGFIYQTEDGRALKMTLNCFRGRWYTHLREYFQDRDEGTWHPTKKGIAVTAEYVDLVSFLFSESGKMLTEIYYRDIDNEKQLELFTKEEYDACHQSME